MFFSVTTFMGITGYWYQKEHFPSKELKVETDWLTTIIKVSTNNRICLHVHLRIGLKTFFSLQKMCKTNKKVLSCLY